MYHLSLHLPVKYRPDRFPFAEVISEKVNLYDLSICLQHIMIMYWHPNSMSIIIIISALLAIYVMSS